MGKCVCENQIKRIIPSTHFSSHLVETGLWKRNEKILLNTVDGLENE